MTTEGMPERIWAKLYCADEGTCHMDATPFNMDGRTEYTRTSWLIERLEGMKPDNCDDDDCCREPYDSGRIAAIDAVIAMVREG